MNFELSEEQKMIQQSVERFVQENYDLTNRVKIIRQSRLTLRLDSEK